MYVIDAFYSMPSDEAVSLSCVCLKMFADILMENEH